MPACHAHVKSPRMAKRTSRDIACCLLARSAAHSVSTVSYLEEVGEAGGHGTVQRLMRCGGRSKLGSYCCPLDPTNDDFFSNHRMVFVLENKDDIIQCASGGPMLRRSEADPAC
jgi:hypothetical protein